jgi:hypothetical protein
VVPAIIQGVLPEIGPLLTTGDQHWMRWIMKGCWELDPKSRPPSAAVNKALEFMSSKEGDTALRVIQSGELDRTLIAACVTRDIIEIHAALLLGADLDATLKQDDIQKIAEVVRKTHAASMPLLKPGFGPLHVTCTLGYIDVVDLLIMQAADVITKPSVLRGDNVLVHTGLFVPPVDWTPLQAACLTGKLDCVKQLIEKGAAVNAFTRKDETPVEIARREGHTEIVAYLNANGAIRNEWLIDLLMVLLRGRWLGDMKVAVGLVIFVFMLVLLGAVIATNSKTKGKILSQRSYRLPASALAVIIWDDWLLDVVIYIWRWHHRITSVFLAIFTLGISVGIFFWQFGSLSAGWIVPGVVALGLVAAIIRGIALTSFLAQDAHRSSWFTSKRSWFRCFRSALTFGSWIGYIVSSMRATQYFN